MSSITHSQVIPYPQDLHLFLKADTEEKKLLNKVNVLK